MTLTRPANLRIDLPLEAIADVCRRWRLTRLEIFGSALRDDFRPDSDLDMLYEFAPEAQVGWELVSLADELERITGRRVDLVSRRAVERSRNWIRRRDILSSARVIYAE